MARVTVEDCIDKISNRFELVLFATHRARALAGGLASTVEPQNDKNSVIALREIADNAVSLSDMRETLIHSIQKQVEVDEPDLTSAPARSVQHARLGRDAAGKDAAVDTMTEEELLRGLAKESPEDPASKLPKGAG